MEPDDDDIASAALAPDPVNAATAPDTWDVRITISDPDHVADGGNGRRGHRRPRPPEVIPLLVGLGVEELSVAPGSVASVLAWTRTLDAAACRDLAVEALDAVSVAEVRALVRGDA